MAKEVKVPRNTNSKFKMEGEGLSHDGQETVTTAIHIPKTTWELLRAVAFRRAQIKAGRVSVSKLIAELVEARRAELEKEL